MFIQKREKNGQWDDKIWENVIFVLGLSYKRHRQKKTLTNLQMRIRKREDDIKALWVIKVILIFIVSGQF